MDAWEWLGSQRIGQTNGLDVVRAWVQTLVSCMRVMLRADQDLRVGLPRRLPHSKPYKKPPQAAKKSNDPVERTVISQSQDSFFTPIMRVIVWALPIPGHRGPFVLHSA